MQPHEEFLRPSVLLESYIEKYKKKTTQFVRKWFKLEGNTLSYSLRERLDARASVFIDKNFTFTKKDPNGLVIGLNFIDKKGKRKVWDLKFSSMSDYVEWVKQLCIAKRPVWDPQNSSKCVECGRNFGFFRRQHHCRNCGRVVCGDHSEHRFILEDLGYHEPVRVCDTCDKQLS